MMDRELFERWPANHGCTTGRVGAGNGIIRCSCCRRIATGYPCAPGRAQMIWHYEFDPPSVERIHAGSRRLHERLARAAA